MILLRLNKYIFFIDRIFFNHFLQ